jgi:methanogenic corrinoid protein MtbC1
MRPGKIVHAGLAELNALADARAAARGTTVAPPLERDLIARLTAGDAAGFRDAIANLLFREGLQRFVLDVLAPLNRAVGDAWMRGELQVFDEHLYTEQVHSALRAAIHAVPRQTGSPKVLLTTLPGEQHGLGLLMVEALLVAEGAQCVSLGPQTPLDDIRRAALAHDVRIVALSFSAAFPVRQASESLATLRRQLGSAIALWAGGELTRRIRAKLPGVVLVPELAAALPALAEWRARAAASGALPAAA